MKTVTGMYIRTVWTVCMSEKEPQKPPEHTSEQVKSQNFLGACAPDPPHTIYKRGPTFCICPGPHNPLGGPGSILFPLLFVSAIKCVHACKTHDVAHIINFHCGICILECNIRISFGYGVHCY